MAAGRYDSAAEQFRRGIDIDSLNPLVLGTGPGLPSKLGEVYEYQGHLEAAVEEYLRVALGATAGELKALRAAYLAGGMRGFWSQWLAFDERLSSGTPRALRTSAILARMGDVEGAVERLEHAYRERDPGLVYLRASPEWEQVREDPRVIAIMERMRLPR